MDSKKLELIKKIKALAERGVGGEQVNAQEMLEQLMKKYDVTEDMLSDDIIKEYDLYFKGYYERRILGQIIYKVTNSPSSASRLYWTRSGRMIRNQMRVHCTEAQRIEIEYLFSIYRDQWYREVERLLDAYITKNELYGDPVEGIRSIDPDIHLSMMMSAIDKVNPRKAIENE